MSKKSNTMPEEKQSKPLTRDELFRSLGYRIYSRPKDGLAIWIKDDYLYEEVDRVLRPFAPIPTKVIQ